MNKLETYTSMEENNELLEYHCSKCGTRVNRADVRCPYCGTELEGFEDDDNDRTVEIKTFTNAVDAGLDKTLLEGEGIECYLKGGSNWGTLFSSSPIRLVVLKKDAKRALEILEE